MTFSEKLKEQNVDLSDKEKVEFLQHFYTEGYNEGIHATNRNLEYNAKLAEVMPKMIKMLNLTRDPVHLQQLSDTLDSMENFIKERGYW